MRTHLLRFAPIFKETLWGGQRIRSYKGLMPDERTIGESWELSSISGNVSVVEGGVYDGKTLGELIREEGAALLGEEIYAAYGEHFPLLVKFIDATQPLSLQVHPNDELAQQRHGSSGKTEMWYVVDADPGSSLINGFRAPVGDELFEGEVSGQTFAEVLQQVEVRPGDVFFLPAGRVHSIGKGCFICEIQQSSDLTYRIYDYDRKDAKGQSRALHVEEAKDAICYEVTPVAPQVEVPVNEPTVVAQCPYFTTAVYRLDEPMMCDYSELDSFVVFICTKGACRVVCGDEEQVLRAGATLLVAAAATGVQLIPEGETTLLECYV
jgi:mannose-6-phosphate isomerase